VSIEIQICNLEKMKTRYASNTLRPLRILRQGGSANMTARSRKASAIQSATVTSDDDEDDDEIDYGDRLNTKLNAEKVQTIPGQ